MEVRPLNSNVFVEQLGAEAMTKGGILLPDGAKKKPQRGKIVSVSDGEILNDGTLRKLQVKKGDDVLFTSYAGTEVKIEDKEYLILNESDIIAIIES